MWHLYQTHRIFSVLMKASRLLYCTILLWFAGCSTGKPIVWIERNVSLLGWRNVQVLPVVDESAKKQEFDVAAIVRQELMRRLEERGLVNVDGTSMSSNIIVAACTLISYEAGSAFARWVAPGTGKTECHIKCTLADKETGKPLGEITAHRTVDAGGLYTIGYERRILSEVAEDIASELDKTTEGVRGDSAR